MKKLLFLGVATLSLSLFGCSGGDSSSAQNPNDAAEQFENPTGTLSSSNADDVGQASVDASLAGVASNPFVFVSLNKGYAKKMASKNTLDEGDVTACIETSETESTIDWECVYNLDTEDTCDGSGTTTTSIAGEDDDFYTISYNDFSVDCGSGSEFSCDGEINISSTNAGLSCSDFSCTFDDEVHSFEGCVNAEGDYLITVDGESFVVVDITTDGSCTNVDISITDSTGSKTMTCTVSSAEEDCTTIDGVETVSSCTIN